MQPISRRGRGLEMGIKGINLKFFIRALKNRRGAEMVEGAISLPLIILTAMLMVRMFTFYLEILNTSVACHVEALERWDSYGGIGMQIYKNSEEVKLLKGGVLLFDVGKEINTKLYMLNEDLIVRGREAFQ